MNGESKRWEFRSYHPEKRTRTKDDEDEEDWDLMLNTTSRFDIWFLGV
jgi:hypothetical protein